MRTSSLDNLERIGRPANYRGRPIFRNVDGAGELNRIIGPEIQDREITFHVQSSEFIIGPREPAVRITLSSCRQPVV
jgi:hypothetical protein